MTLDDEEQRFVDIVERPWWFVTNVMADEEGPAFAYTTGLYKNWDHPEIIIFGLASDTMGSILNSIGEDVRNGKRIDVGRRYGDVIERYDVQFLPIGRPEERDEFGWAFWYYHRYLNPARPFLAVQCVWPSKANVWPWDPAWPAELADVQPLLGQRLT